MCVLYEAVFTVHVLDPMPWQTDNDVIVWVQFKTIALEF